MESGKRLSYYNAAGAGHAHAPVRGRGRPKGKPKPFTADERRVRNAQLERGRRDLMADAFQSLRESLGQEPTATRAETLRAATAFLKVKRSSLEALRRQNVCLEQQIVILEEAQKAKTANFKLKVEHHSSTAIGTQCTTQSYKDEGSESPSNSLLQEECFTKHNCSSAFGAQYSTQSYKDEGSESPSNYLLQEECFTEHNCSNAIGAQYSTQSYKDEGSESPSNYLLQEECFTEHNCSNAIGAQYSTQSYKHEGSECPSNYLIKKKITFKNFTEHHNTTAAVAQYYMDECSKSSNILQQDCLESEPWSPPFDMDAFRTLEFIDQHDGGIIEFLS